MKYIFQFARILLICFLGEVLAYFLPFPVPASVYGLVLMLLALRFGIYKLADVKEAGGFLIAIMPLLFVPAAAGVMELWDELAALLIPCLIAVVPITLLVMAVSGRVTQAIQRRIAGRQDK